MSFFHLGKLTAESEGPLCGGEREGKREGREGTKERKKGTEVMAEKQT